MLARPVCPWDHLVAEIAQYLRRSERPRALAVLDEAFWGAWVWPALAREELRRLEGVLLTIESEAPPAGNINHQSPAPVGVGRPDLSAVHWDSS